MREWETDSKWLWLLQRTQTPCHGRQRHATTGKGRKRERKWNSSSSRRQSLLSLLSPQRLSSVSHCESLTLKTSKRDRHRPVVVRVPKIEDARRREELETLNLTVCKSCWRLHCSKQLLPAWCVSSALFNLSFPESYCPISNLFHRRTLKAVVSNETHSWNKSIKCSRVRKNPAKRKITAYPISHLLLILRETWYHFSFTRFLLAR